MQNNMTNTQVVHRDVQRRVMAAMETGNQAVARTTLREYADINSTAAQSLQMEVVAAYGIHL